MNTSKKRIEYAQAAIVLLAVFLLLPTKSIAAALTTTELKRVAEKYTAGSERVGAPITLRYQTNMYVYVPVTVNGTIPSTYPGVMMTSDGKILKDAKILSELYNYPGLILEFSSSIKKFDALANNKITALAEYCRILEVQKIKFDALNTFNNVGGVLYDGAKLAFDAVGLVKSGVTGLASLTKDLAKGAIKDSIASYFTSADMREVRASTQGAYNDAKSAYSRCKAARTAWNRVISTSGQANTTYAKQATAQIRDMFSAEAAAMTHMRNSLAQIHNYPQIVANIGAADYARGMEGMNSLISRLTEEKEYWADAYSNALDANSRTLWAAEQIDRVNAKSTSCQAITMSTGGTFFTHTPASAPCSSYGNTVGSSAIHARCNASSAAWRTFWVKPISVVGRSKVRFKAGLGLTDHSRFFSECNGVGVKYDDYVSVAVLSSDPRPALAAECRSNVSSDEWAQCSIPPTAPTVLASCGVPRCASSASCDFTVNTAGLQQVYVLFHASDAWMADIEGVMQNASWCPV